MIKTIILTLLLTVAAISSDISKALNTGDAKNLAANFHETVDLTILDDEGMYSKIQAEQIRKTGAEIVATPCHNCVDQLTQINVTFKLKVHIKTIAEIVADAIVLD